MALDEGAEAIAAEWGIDADLLDDVDWELEPIDSNEGDTVGYFVRFPAETRRELLDQLGVAPGKFHREVSLNAFDEPDYTDDDYDRDLRMREGIEETASTVDPDDETFPIDEPMPDLSEVMDDKDHVSNFPDLPIGQAYLTDEKDRVLTDHDYRPIIVDVPTRAVDNDGLVTPASYHAGRIEALRLEMLSRLDNLEAVIKNCVNIAPNRGHNGPPELLDIERSVSPEQFDEITAAIVEIRREGNSSTPDIPRVTAQVSVLMRLTRFFQQGSLWIATAAVSGLIGDATTDAYKNHQHQIYQALSSVVESTTAWLNSLPSLLQ